MKFFFKCWSLKLGSGSGSGSENTKTRLPFFDFTIFPLFLIVLIGRYLVGTRYLPTYLPTVHIFTRTEVPFHKKDPQNAAKREPSCPKNS